MYVLHGNDELVQSNLFSSEESTNHSDPKAEYCYKTA